MMEKFAVRTVTIRGVIYIRVDDVAALIREVGATEETDVRKRLEEVAVRVEKLQ